MEVNNNDFNLHDQKDGKTARYFVLEQARFLVSETTVAMHVSNPKLS